MKLERPFLFTLPARCRQINLIGWLATATTLSIIFFALIGILLTSLGSHLTIAAWEMIFVGSFLVSMFVACYFLLPSPRRFKRSRLSTLRLLLLGALPLLSLLPAFISKFRSIRMQLGGHGYFHSAYIYQIVVGQTPPENVTLPGHPANFYWYFHAFVAVLVDLLNISPPLASTILFVLLFLMTLFLMTQVIGLLHPQENRGAVRIVLGLFGMFGMNLFGMIHAFILAESPINLAALPEPAALFGDNRLTTLLTYYLNFSGFSVGVLCFVLALLVVMRVLAGQATPLVVLMGFLAGFAALTLHTVSGIFMFATMIPSLLLTYLWTTWLKRPKPISRLFSDAVQAGWEVVRQRWLEVLAVGGVILILGIVLLRFLLGASDSLSSGIYLDLFSLTQLDSIVSMTYGLIPFFILGGWYAIQKRDSRLIFLMVLAVLGLSLGYLLHLENNQYKFVYLSSIAVCLVATKPIWEFLFNRQRERISRVGGITAVFMLALMFFNILGMGISRLETSFTIADNFTAEGIHINVKSAYQGEPAPEVVLTWAQQYDYPKSDLIYADLYQWIRSHTPSKTVVVAPMMHKDQSSLPLLSERLPYVVNGLFFNNGIVEYQTRVELVEKLYGAKSTTADRQDALAELAESLPGRPMVVVLPHSLAFDQQSAYLGELLYAGRAADLYQLTAICSVKGEG